MYDDFMSGYNSGNSLGVQQEAPKQLKPLRQNTGQYAGTYDKTKLIRMTGLNGEEGEIYASGKMYVIFPDGKSQIRTFPSRPWGIRYMQKRGWVLV